MDANEELARLARERGEFLSTFSHELRTPLNAVLGFSDMLLREAEGPLNEGQAEDVRNIHRSGQHLLALANDILDMAKLESGELVLRRERVDLGTVASEVLALLAPDYTAKGLAVSLDIPAPGESRVFADRRRLEQIVFNLLSNAIKYTDWGEVRLRIAPENGGVRLDVADSGIGIPEADRDHIFQPFRQSLQGGADGRRRGVGLGLAITRRLVEMHGGRIWMVSEPGRGSTFSVAIPKTLANATGN